MKITGGHFTSGVQLTQGYVPPSIVTANLYANYDAATGISNNTFLDSSGNGHNATLYNSPANVTVNGTTVLALSSASSQFFGDTNSYGSDLDDAFTFDVWCSPTSAGTAGTLIAEWGDGSWASGWQDNQMGFTAGSINCGLYNTGYAVAKASWTANTWYHIVMTYDGSIMRTYVDGVAGGTTSGAKQNPSENGFPGTGLSMGMPCADYLNGVENYFNGYIGAWKIYDRALTAEEVLQNYQALLSRYTD